MHGDRRRALGERGEDLAAEHMRSLGFATLARNVRIRRGEIDLIAFDGTTLAFIEVKSRLIAAGQRRVRADQQPLLGLRAHQRGRLRALAAAWLREEPRRPTAQTIRFDAIGVLLGPRGELRRLEHVEDAW